MPSDAAEPDWSQPCGMEHHRPDRLVGTLVQGSRKKPFLFCNRPARHAGPHRVITENFVVLLEWTTP